LQLNSLDKKFFKVKIGLVILGWVVVHFLVWYSWLRLMIPYKKNRTIWRWIRVWWIFKFVTCKKYIYLECFVLLSRMLGYLMDINGDEYPTILKSSIRFLIFFRYP
jgi:hypothetical protein